MRCSGTSRHTGKALQSSKYHAASPAPERLLRKGARGWPWMVLHHTTHCRLKTNDIPPCATRAEVPVPPIRQQSPKRRDKQALPRDGNPKAIDRSSRVLRPEALSEELAQAQELQHRSVCGGGTVGTQEQKAPPSHLTLQRGPLYPSKAQLLLLHGRSRESTSLQNPHCKIQI